MRPEQILAKPGAPVIALRQLDLSVLEPYLTMLTDPESRRLTATTADFSRAQIIDWLGSRASTANRRDWAIVDAEGIFLGEVVLNEFDDSKNSMNIRIALAGPSVYGYSIGRQAMALALIHAFDELALSRVTLEVLIDNARARRSYASVGFAAGREFNDKHLRYLRMSINKHQFVTALATAAIAKHLKPGWQFALDSGKRRAGLCNYTDRRISISKHHIEVHSVDDSLQVLAHELGHALSGKAAGHSKVWLSAAKSLGYRAEKFSGTEIAREKAPWIGVCPEGHEHFRYRKPTRPLSCGVCGRGFSTANLIAWRANEPEA